MRWQSLPSDPQIAPRACAIIDGVIARAVRLAHATSSTTSIALLVGFNMVPLAGVLFWGWNVATLLVLYWVENGIVGVLNVAKILLARGQLVPGSTPAVRFSGNIGVSNAAIAGFFLIHYGIFWLVHGVFVWTLPLFFGGSGPLAPFSPDIGQGFGPDALAFDHIVINSGPDLSAVAWGALGLAISHGASFVLNFLGRGEYLRISAAQQMFAPYGRLVILHLSIIFGAFISLAIGSPVGAIAVLVILKTIVDLGLTLRAHGWLAAPPRVA